MIAAVFYYNYEQELKSQPLNSDTYVEMDAEDLSELTPEERELLDQNDLD